MIAVDRGGLFAVAGPVAGRQEVHSQALEADALHFSTDIWSSTVVLLGLCGVWRRSDRAAVAGKGRCGGGPGRGGLVVWVSLGSARGRSTTSWTASPPTSRTSGRRGGRQCRASRRSRKVRLRRSGAEVFADVTSRSATRAVREGPRIADQAAEAGPVGGAARPTWWSTPSRSPPAHEDLTTKIRMLAARHGLGAHGIRIYRGVSGGRILELHLEVNESLWLRGRSPTGHDVRRRTAQGRAGLDPDRHAHRADRRYVVHAARRPPSSPTPPKREGPTGRWSARPSRSFSPRARLAVKPHDVEVQSVGGEFQVSFHCTLDASLAITTAHELTEQLESHLRLRVPGLGRVVIHVEPA